jgi:4-amino-4-deoxy-L-arabinose transferase-like glycosyltransferase
MFESTTGGQISWLMPAALVLALVAFIVMRGKRTDLRRPTLMLFTAWFVITGLTFSFAEGIFHDYYTVALAPAIAGVVAMGASVLWSYRAELWSRIIAAVVVLGTVTWGFVLLDEASDWLPWLRWVVVALGVVAAVLLLLPQRGRRMTGATIAVAITASLLAPTAWTLDTVSTGHSGSIVTAGPTVASATGGFGGGGGAPGAAGGRGGFGGAQAGGPPTGTRPGFGAGSRAAGQAATGARGGGAGLLDSSSVGTTLSKLLKADASSYKWVAAAVGSNSAAGYQLATQEAVMPIGGFNGSDPSPTLAEFKADVAKGEIHYFIGGTLGASNGGSNVSSQIASWVAAHYTAKTVDGVTLYDLTK